MKLAVMTFAAALASVTGSVCAQDLPSVLRQSVMVEQARLISNLRAQWARRVEAGLTPVDVVEPSLISGKILTPTVDVTKAPGVPELSVTFNAGTVGVSTIEATIVSPSGAQYVISMTGLPAYPMQTGKSTIKLQVNSEARVDNLSLYSESGTWSLTQLTLFGEDGSFIGYSGAQLAALFPSLSIDVVTPSPDTVPPTIGKGRVLTPTVSLGSSQPIFAVRISTSDALSGVNNVGIGLASPNGAPFFPGASGTPTAPVAHGNVVAFAQIPANSPTGTYSITSISSCDVVSNCTTISTPEGVAAALGTTTFEVTN